MACHSLCPLSRQKDRTSSKRTVQSRELRDSSRYFANDLGLHPERKEWTNRQSVENAVAIVYTGPNQLSGAYVNVRPLFILVLVTLFGSPSAAGGQELASLQESCNAGDSLACYEIGAMFRTGDSVQRDPMRATVYLERACNEGAMPACAALGTMYQRGEGVDQDTRRALGLLEQSCDGDVFLSLIHI